MIVGSVQDCISQFLEEKWETVRMLGALVSLCAIGVGQNSPMPVVVPQPVSMTASADTFTLNDKTAIVSPSVAAGRMLQSFLSPATGYPLDVRSKGDKNAIHLKLRSKADDKLGSEGYRLSVKADRVDIEANTEAGLFYGSQTLRQLLPPDIYRKAPVAKAERRAKLHAERVCAEVHRHACNAQDELLPLASNRGSGLAH
jgi:N-acetyl-beta-hexosaminidase